MGEQRYQPVLAVISEGAVVEFRPYAKSLFVNPCGTAGAGPDGPEPTSRRDGAGQQHHRGSLHFRDPMAGDHRWPRPRCNNALIDSCEGVLARVCQSPVTVLVMLIRGRNRNANQPNAMVDVGVAAEPFGRELWW